MQVECTYDGPIAVVTFSNPPVNSLSIGSGLMEALSGTLGKCLADSAVDAVLITADGRMFSGGADIDDFNVFPDTLEITRSLTSTVIERASKPIIVALHGMALGGGLELALAAHYRIASPDAKLGLPEVTIGLLPGGGGTQRLPRLVGVEKALDLMLGGKPVSAQEALAIGLIDKLAGTDLLAEAVEWAKSLTVVRRTCDLSAGRDGEEALAAARMRAARTRLSDAPKFIVECVAAAVESTFDEGMAVEARLFEQLRVSEASLALRHAFKARRQVGRIPGLGQTTVLDIGSVAVIGAGTMGIGIALSLLAAGYPVTLVDAKPEALAQARERIVKSVDADVAKGRLDASAAAARKDLLLTATALEAVSGADLVIEAVFEDLAVKASVFRALDAVCKPDAILATNTSTLDVDAIAAHVADPSRVVGMHFFSPANIMRLLEVIRGKSTSDSVLAAVMTFSRRIGKTGVVAGVCDGFIGNRIFEEYLRQAYFLLEEGALPAQIDAAMEAWGMAMGPLRVMDLAGQDIGWSIRKRRAIEQPDRPYSRIPDRICEAGRFGQKAGAGFYLYPDGRTPQPDPSIDELVIAYSQEIGVARRTVSDTEIVERCLYAMVNEGARIVEEGIAYRPLDIDAVYFEGYGFPAERGGPMFQADRHGLDHVVSQIATFRDGYQGWAWEAAPLLLRLVEENRNFEARND